MSSEKKKIIANLLIKKQSINNIKELHDLYCSDEDIKNNKVSAYSWDCKTCGAEDIRCDLNGLVQTGDNPEFISIKDDNFWDGCEQRNDPNYEQREAITINYNNCCSCIRLAVIPGPQTKKT